MVTPAPAVITVGLRLFPSAEAADRTGLEIAEVGGQASGQGLHVAFTTGTQSLEVAPQVQALSEVTAGFGMDHNESTQV